MAYDLNMEFHLPATPERVMELLTDQQLISEWSVADAEFDAKVGGKYTMFDGWTSGEVTAISATELAYTWKTTDWAEDTAHSQVHYKISADGEGTKVELSHTGLPSEEEMNGHKDGWDEHFFGALEEYIETDEDQY